MTNKFYNLVLQAATLILPLVFSAPSFAGPYEPSLTEQEAIDAQFQLGAQWAHDVIHGEKPNLQDALILKNIQRLLPFAVTAQDTGSRVARTVFRIEANKDRLMLLAPQRNKLQLIVGAPVSDEVRAASFESSVYLLTGKPKGREKFDALMALIVEVEGQMKSEFGVSAFSKSDTQDIYNRMVIQLEGHVAMYLDLNPKMLESQLYKFLSMLNQSACERLLKPYK